jgi:hypothetical protein
VRLFCDKERPSFPAKERGAGERGGEREGGRGKGKREEEEMKTERERQQAVSPAFLFCYLRTDLV